MATLSEKIEAESKMRELLAKNELAQPDRIEYGYTCIRLFWEQPKTCVIVQIDEPPEGWAFAEDMRDEAEEDGPDSLAPLDADS